MSSSFSSTESASSRSSESTSSSSSENSSFSSGDSISFIYRDGSSSSSSDSNFKILYEKFKKTYIRILKQKGVEHSNKRRSKKIKNKRFSLSDSDKSDFSLDISNTSPSVSDESSSYSSFIRTIKSSYSSDSEHSDISGTISSELINLDQQDISGSNSFLTDKSNFPKSSRIQPDSVKSS